ncbi:MAG: DUF748 domain-containing protein [Nitrospirae bacterium]|nr:DUF748 domain-containing protein [Nitrospirota bacterium]
MKSTMKKILIAAVIMFLLICISLVFLIANSSRILKSQIEKIAGDKIAIQNISLRWNSVDMSGIKVISENGAMAEAEIISIQTNFWGILKKGCFISQLILEKPSIRLRISKDGSIMYPVVPVFIPACHIENLLVRDSFVHIDKEKPLKTIKSRGKGGISASANDPQQRLNISIGKITIQNGTVLYLDGGVSKEPHQTRVEGIDFILTDIHAPFKDKWSDYSFSGKIPKRHSTGLLKSTGKINIGAMNADSNIDLKGLDITGFKPYFIKKVGADVSRGTLGLKMNMRIRSKILDAAGISTLRNLELAKGGGISERFLGVSGSALLSVLKNSNNELIFDFVIKGDMDDPMFNLKEALIEQITSGLAQKIGKSVSGVAESAAWVGKKAAISAAEGLKGAKKGIERVLK